MTYKDILAEVTRLPVEQRLELMEALVLSLQADKLHKPGTSSSVHRVRGLLKPSGPILDDPELKDAYTRHLIEKYT